MKGANRREGRQRADCHRDQSGSADRGSKSGADMPFTDVEIGAYYYDAVLWAAESGVTSGTGDTTFSPERDCLRAQIVTFLYRTYGMR